MSKNVKRIIQLAIFIGAFGYLFTRNFEVIKVIYDNKKELSESTSVRKTGKACIINYFGKNRRDQNTFTYQFKINGKQYKGISKYNMSKQERPPIGDSIWVYYKEDDPNVNLWVGMFE